ncbi:endonuclease/exonuclease/phosphatase [Streptomyces bathyalis]|uniref:Endonuclease/exonuclease/phosphatase n=1 Tax=Streptomyces bathyalis TaxID=2710756 RepID=A0A7T1WRA6_9ACTN|nr:endonuclease/exonuclease/phosphatase family protein [Streptomyces bathyalis]QPP05892.1 endonuclease/exonuclease/phosphatase [Streptomyces bathyalis]
MTTLRLATFNVENLFARWRFRDNVDPASANTKGWIVDQTRFDELGMDDKAITGAAVREIKADVLCLQEVENVDTLKKFRGQALGGRSQYPYIAGVDGNDPRLIDVAVLSKLPITRIRSHQHLMDPSSPTASLFSRDCLEVDIEVEVSETRKSTVTVFVNHFKSMIGGRNQTRGKRERQATKVMEIVEDRFGHQAPGDHPFVVCGDLNDYIEPNGDGSSGIDQLVTWDQLENVVGRLPQDEQWTHFWAGGNEYRQLDYLLPSRSLAGAAPAPDVVPEIFRNGTALRATRYKGPRFPGIGLDKPKASDHCPVIFELSID